MPLLPQAAKSSAKHRAEINTHVFFMFMSNLPYLYLFVLFYKFVQPRDNAAAAQDKAHRSA
jgi:hypothetical protein